MRITATQIAKWAETKEAQGYLPRLIRRLVHAAGTPTQVAFPVGDSTSLPGWDGELVSEHDNSWVPIGKSFWEFSCEAPVTRKENRDYDKRTRQTLNEVRTNSTFVFVSARRWSQKARWLEGKRATREWVEVSAYDADDLEQWREQSPTVALQFAEELGIAGPGVESIAKHWGGWSQQSDPSISAEAFFIDREGAREQFIVDLRRQVEVGQPIVGWGSVPYYAMFPVWFADAVVREFTASGDVVLDPFAGRGTSIFSGSVQGRVGVGIELNSVGWVYGRTKLNPAPREAVEDRIYELGTRTERYRHADDELPEFFKLCFAPSVRRFLLTAREHLDWRRNKTDRTTMALLLVHLHGKRTDSLSNQMRQTKSMSPDYAIRWWQQRRMSPPSIDPVSFLMRKLDWRYARGVPETARSHVYLGDSVTRLPQLVARVRSGEAPRASLLFTSPPYFHLTHYHYDQWLRLWLLGGSPSAARVGGRHRGKFEGRVAYRALLARVFGAAAHMMKRNGVVYVRTDRRAFTYRTTVEVLGETFPHKKLLRRARPVQGPTQTQLFGNGISQLGEVDLILLP